jgi:hypothetical protein
LSETEDISKGCRATKMVPQGPQGHFRRSRRGMSRGILEVLPRRAKWYRQEYRRRVLVARYPGARSEQ